MEALARRRIQPIWRSKGYGKRRIKACRCSVQSRRLLQKRQGVEKDASEAVAWYRKAADQGYAGAHYQNGDGVAQNNSHAASWFRKAADQGDVSAQFVVGVHFENGLGVHRDVNEAIIWYGKAAEQGLKLAAIKLQILGLPILLCLASFCSFLLSLT